MIKRSFDELIGSRIGEYIIEEYLGEGGQAVVFKAHSQQLGTKCALKVFGLLASVTRSLEDGLRDAQKQSQVDHSAVVKVYPPGIEDVEFRGEATQVLYVPMSFSQYGNCDEEPPFVNRQLSETDFKAMVNLLDGLGEIHNAGLLHNDIKPANILKFHEKMYGHDREDLRITDFGIAKVQAAVGIHVQDPSGVTPTFMSPEQLDHHYTEKGDIYSMGATLYYMITGQLPIRPPASEERDIYAWQKAHKLSPRPDATRDNPLCPPRLALLIIRMMSVEPTNRPSVAECVVELERLAELVHGKLFEFRDPPKSLRAALESDRFPLHGDSAFRGIFRPEVHTASRTALFVIRLKMRPPVVDHYKHLIHTLTQQFADSFTMYETWGSYDVNLFLWTDQDEITKLNRNLGMQFPGSEPQFFTASAVQHFHEDVYPSAAALSPVMALAIQEDVFIPGLDHRAYICSRYPAEIPERSVRAFTYVEAAEDLNRFLVNAIADHIRAKVQHLWTKRREAFHRMSVIELAPGGVSGLRTAGSTAVIVDFVASEYRYLAEVPTAIMDVMGENSVRTLTCLETRRIVIQSDKILQ